MIEMTEALKMIEDAHALAEKMNGLDETDANTNDKRKSAERAKISSDLLLLAHLCDSARVEVMNQYHGFKGKPTPRVSAPEL